MQEINEYDFQHHVSVLQERNLSTRTINMHRQVIKASFNRAMKDRYIKENKISLTRPLKQKKTPIVLLSPEELDALDRNIEEPIRFLVEFVFSSTKRHGEAVNLRWEDVNFDRKTIHIHSSAEYRVKFDSEQYLALSDPLENLLRRIERFQRDNEIETQYVFVDEDGKRLTEKRVCKAIQEGRTRAGLGNHVTIKALRATGASHLKNQGESTYLVGGVLNHASEESTRGYLAVPPDDQKRALDKLSYSKFIARSRNQ
jgi:integrase/recombinase XerC